jgi:transcriptional regulator with XRE-family HTH domain
MIWKPNMKGRNALLAAPPYAVERAVKKLGADLRTARLRRNLTAADVAQRIGTSRFAVADAERGKPSTSVAVYVALLWVYGLADRLADAADPGADAEGARLALLRTPQRARHRKSLSNDF